MIEPLKRGVEYDLCLIIKNKTSRTVQDFLTVNKFVNFRCQNSNGGMQKYSCKKCLQEFFAGNVLR